MKKKISLLVSLLLFSFFISSCSRDTKTTINAVGSSALQPLVETAGENYMNEHSGTYINIQGGGSGTGLSQVQQKAVDIGNSDLFAEEKKGIAASKLKDNKICVVGIVPIVNKDLKIDNLSMSQLRKIFAGEITNWKEVGGPDLKVTIINRASGSGTRSVFEQSVMKNLSTARSQEQDSSGMVRKIVHSTPGSISYTAIPYVNNEVKTIKVNNVEANQHNIEDNKWKIWAYEHMYTTKHPKKITRDFIKYILSDKVQKNVVQKMNYIPVKSMNYTKDASGKAHKISIGSK